jgi:hypothetical protein
MLNFSISNAASGVKQGLRLVRTLSAERVSHFNLFCRKACD